MRHYNIEDRSNLVGIMLVVFGGLFLITNFDLLPIAISNIVLNWKGIILAIGIVLLVTKPNKMPGMVMIFIASYLMLSQFVWQEFDINIGINQIFWPGMMIVIGYIILKKRNIATRRSNAGSSFDYLSDSNVMGGGEVKVQSENFKGGHATAVFGGASYDMSRAKLAEGRHTLDVFAVFGGFTFVIPSDWDVQLEVTAIFGALVDSRKHIKPAEKDNKKQLRIKGFVLFGGGEIKNY